MQPKATPKGKLMACHMAVSSLSEGKFLRLSAPLSASTFDFRLMDGSYLRSAFEVEVVDWAGSIMTARMAENS